ncbi:hypothetical protein AAFF_G00401620 [Aldrovandia affinis]|uniref:Uncharacterized protein n=1 Tax=Aldrovandia affinis TaxID=143900 RepID=A0AAD7WKF7_9TELE|nr:hypothetical protein AAFF_G00401620 [Aldrovandia affinis]
MWSCRSAGSAFPVLNRREPPSPNSPGLRALPPSVQRGRADTNQGRRPRPTCSHNKCFGERNTRKGWKAHRRSCQPTEDGCFDAGGSRATLHSCRKGGRECVNNSQLHKASCCTLGFQGASVTGSPGALQREEEEEEEEEEQSLKAGPKETTDARGHRASVGSTSAKQTHKPRAHWDRAA